MPLQIQFPYNRQKPRETLSQLGQFSTVGTLQTHSRSIPLNPSDKAGTHIHHWQSTKNQNTKQTPSRSLNFKMSFTSTPFKVYQQQFKPPLTKATLGERKKVQESEI